MKYHQNSSGLPFMRKHDKVGEYSITDNKETQRCFVYSPFIFYSRTESHSIRARACFFQIVRLILQLHILGGL